MENLIKMDDLGVPLFWKHPYPLQVSNLDTVTWIFFWVACNDMHHEKLFDSLTAGALDIQGGSSIAILNIP